MAAVLAAFDLVQKARAPVNGHPRGPLYDALAAGMVVALAVVVPRVPSRGLAVVGGIAAAGALGNLVSALVFPGGVPNPIVTKDVAFNLADLCASGGAAALVVGAAVYGMRNRELLHEPLASR